MAVVQDDANINYSPINLNNTINNVDITHPAHPAHHKDQEPLTTRKRKVKTRHGSVVKRIKSWFVVHPAHRPDTLSMVLCGFFFVNTVTAELISGKLFIVGPFTVSIGSIMWPFVFLTTDVTNEYFGKRMVQRLSYLMAIFLGYIYALLTITMRIPASEFSPVQQQEYINVFGQSNWIIIGSLVAFLVGQLVDISVYHFMRTWTKGKHLWLRSTGSTVVSQLVDTFVVGFIAFFLPHKLSFLEYINLSAVAYVYKLIVAFLMTPAVYGVHHMLDKFLGKDVAEAMISRAASYGNKEKDGGMEGMEDEDEEDGESSVSELERM